ncbi:heat shock protein GrpE [Aquisphaera giovannonii]|uniref:Protein GrpE n=1 Tax=Aquisphaera giovannonii TaxID=406548 RepID=A0A5B9W7K0_9BACT|nr:nucleotide exchange factor GrpE [Aquisphaera giovannonii]QEH36656.1 heat shock protein GrpE [Aquisphaera giovannonii]
MTTPETERDPQYPDGDAGPAGAATGAQDPAAVLKERDELKDQLLRSRAEFANYQKRARQQAEADREYAVGNLARDLLDAMDNLERAEEALRASGQEGVSSGLEMVRKQILATLAKYKIEPIEALGQHFDPNLHEALMRKPAADVPEGTVVMELGKGYRIHDRVLRPSKVAVSVSP